MKFKLVLFFLGALIAAIISLPYFLTPFFCQKAGLIYTSIPLAVQHADHSLYMTIMRRIITGSNLLGDLNVYEMQGAANIWPILPFYLLSKLYLLAKDVNNLPLLSNFIFIPVLFLGLFVFFYRISASKGLSIASSCCALLLSSLFFRSPWNWINPSYLVSFFSGPLWFNRIVYPQISFLFLILFLIKSQEFFIDRNIKHLLPVGIIYSLSFYVYFYLWTYISVFLCVLAVIMLIQREYRAFLWLSLAILLSLSFSIPLWVNIHKFTLLPESKDFLYRMGMFKVLFKEAIFTTAPNPFLIIFFIFLFFRRKKSYIFLFLATLTAYILSKAYLFIGLDFQFNHYVLFILAPLTPALILIIFHEIVISRTKLSNNPNKYFYIPLTALILLIGVVIGVIYSCRYYPAFSIEKGIPEAVSFLNKLGEKDKVILSVDPETNTRLAYLTGLYLYYPSGQSSIISRAQLLQRAAKAYSFYEIDPRRVLNYNRVINMYTEGLNDPIFKRFKLGSSGLIKILLPQYYLFCVSSSYNFYRQEEVDREAIFQAYRQDQEKKVGLSPFKIDYIWQGSLERNFGKKDLLKEKDLTLIFNNQNISIFKVKDK